jgi:RNA polymerase sigma-B factor
VLFERYADQHDPIDREVLVERFLPLARSLASRYVRHGEPFDDIFQVACLGLVKAVDGFEVGRGRAFSSYAVPTIVGEIKRHYRDRTWSIHVPRDLQDLALAVSRVAPELERKLLRKPTVGELAEALEVSDEEVLDALQAWRAHRSDSLDAPASSVDREEPGRTVGETLGTTAHGYEQIEQRLTLNRMMAGMTARDRLVVRLRFERDLTQGEIGEHVGISQMQVSRVLRQALARLHAVAQRSTADAA